MNWKEPKVYAAKNKDESVIASSRSGGIFTALSDKILEKNGVVYGCILTEDFRAVHVRAKDTWTRDLMRGSKYVQSKMGDTYSNVEADLKAGREVLFTGTSCQVAGLQGYLGKEYANLLCVDIVCHGVPSPAVLEKYLLWQERINQKRILAVDFRNKREFGWHAHIETLTMEGGEKINSRVFRNLFYGHNILRPSCYECPYKSILHPGDITIADYWGIEKAAPVFDDDKGVSLVLINNDKGSTIWQAVRNNVNLLSTKIEDSMQPPLKAPFPRPKERDSFWRDFYSKDMDYIVKKYGGDGLKKKIRRKLGRVKRRIFK